MAIPFRPIACLLFRSLHPVPRVEFSAGAASLHNLSPVDANHRTLITVNHYSAIDFRAWWIVITISAIYPANIHWVVTSGWENSGWLTYLTHWLFPFGSKILGFTPMPAMPPNPSEAEQRAQAVRSVLSYASRTANPVIGLAPEGGDSPGGALGRLPSGVGRFIHLLTDYCPQVLPVGVWKDNGQIKLKFGEPYKLTVPLDIPAKERDRWVGDTVMHRIAEQLPPYLRGDYQ
jgi:hypothetical protein